MSMISRFPKETNQIYIYTKSCNVQSYALHFNSLRELIISLNQKKNDFVALH